MSEFKLLFKRFEEERRVIFCEMPAKIRAHEFIDEFVNFLFPVNLGRNMSELEAESTYHILQFKLKELLWPIKNQLYKSIDDTTRDFFVKIPEIYDMLLLDAKELCKYDPAANSLGEVILTYPGFYATCVYRISHELHSLKVPILPRLISEYSHSKTGIDIHPGATIGSPFFIDHGTGIVIGETALIHNNVRIYQGVTLGALSVEKSMANSKRHPTIENNVTIYAGATILGGNTIVGHDSVIGGNVWLTETVQPFSLVLNKAETKVIDKTKKD